MLLSRQVDYLRGKDLGFDAEQVVAIPTQTDDGTALMERFRQALATRREVVRVTRGSTPMSDRWSRAGVKIDGQCFQSFHIRTDYRFLETFEMDPPGEISRKTSPRKRPTPCSSTRRRRCYE